MKYANIMGVYFESALPFLDFLVHACVLLPGGDKCSSADESRGLATLPHLKSAARATVSRLCQQMPRSSETMSKMMD